MFISPENEYDICLDTANPIELEEQLEFLK